MRRSGDTGRIKRLLAVAMTAALSVTAIACSPVTEPVGTAGSDISPANTEVEQSAATTMMLETVSTEITPTNTPTPSPSPTPTLAPEERIVTVSFTGAHH